MVMPEILELKDALVGEIAEVGDWIVANLETSIAWPVTYQKQDFDGRTFFLIPLANDHYPAVALKRGEDKLNDAKSAILRFTSAMSWVESSGAIVVGFTGGRRPVPLRREKSFGHTITRDLNLTDLAEGLDERQGLALALMREGRGLTHPAYAFLSFYRVLEAAMPDGKVRKQWQTDNIDAIMDRQGLEALEELKKAGIKDVGGHLYKSGRMAIAHAQSDPIINPDDASDFDRIAGELPVMRGLAELAIERVLGVKTRSTIFREHLYELAGFKALIGAERCASIDSGEIGRAGEGIELPLIDVELRRKEPFPPLHGMRPVEAHQENRRLELWYRSADDLVDMRFALDFAEERLTFDWMNDIRAGDDGSARAAENAAALNRFILEYVGNGELHIFNSDDRSLLSRVDAFIPCNYWADHDGLNKKIEDWNAEAARRKEAGL
ncbi:methylamine utilization protein MauJ [Sphingomonas jaspsi]|uniref:methylamine utilization protein MauJ n=1 Tax=Sphingomonas jaspsi TaxID=392409 RepID=UPI000566FAA3|nr:methylamine utilization protein MauJ [Sphingomonas jaspsi]